MQGVDDQGARLAVCPGSELAYQAVMVEQVRSAGWYDGPSRLQAMRARRRRT
ncbi:MAG TPA: hypothetical protein VFW54_03260 [Propionibacteriaceae bacterium]|nr:hypothetical protein [Propionibacteriaceae bacterium]